MYLDPGFGSMLIQVLVASLAAAGAMVGIFWSKIKSLFTRGKKSADIIDIDTEETETNELEKNEDDKTE